MIESITSNVFFNISHVLVDFFKLFALCLMAFLTTYVVFLFFNLLFKFLVQINKDNLVNITHGGMLHLFLIENRFTRMVFVRGKKGCSCQREL